MNRLKKVALRWCLGVSASHVKAFESGAGLAGVTLDKFVIVTVASETAKLQARDRQQEAEIDAAVEAYERQRGWN